MKKIIITLSIFLFIGTQTYASQNPRTQVLHYKKNKITIMYHPSSDKKVSWGNCKIKGDTLSCPYNANKVKISKGIPNPYVMKLNLKKDGAQSANDTIAVANDITVSLFVLAPNKKNIPPTTDYTPTFPLPAINKISYIFKNKKAHDFTQGLFYF